jgi:hypothetical protein
MESVCIAKFYHSDLAYTVIGTLRPESHDADLVKLGEQNFPFLVLWQGIH